ncbi:MAG: hypothetical protein QOE31_2874 [Solirubrobacteraceae bacterium]|jgi:aryl-alcohol dehydrogenase-like predicted oxidoreductase|nr:hypothetical protein [Solirubrobacteraceae bacterium]
MGTAGDGPPEALDAALGYGLTHGANIVDTAANYRGGQAESIVGAVLRRLSEHDELSRDEVVLVTKGGYLLPGEDSAGRRHSIEPDSLTLQLRRSVNRLTVTCLDVYLLHNPEDRLLEGDRSQFDAELRRAFEFLEQACDRGLVASYGVATWHGLRVAPDHRLHLDLAGLKRLAREAAGGEDRFRFVELPISTHAPEALLDLQRSPGGLVSPLAAAGELGLSVLASAVLGGPRAARGTDGRAATRVARSVPGITSALVGAGRLSHAVALIAAAGEPRLDLDRLAAALTR